MTKLKPYPEYKDSGVEWLGEVPAHWQTPRLSRYVTIRNGSDYKDVEVEDGGYPVIGSGGEFRRASEYLYDGESVLFGRKGTLNRPLHVTGRFWTVDTMFYTEIDQKAVLPRFLYYCATQFPFSYLQTNTALPSMTQGDLSAIKIPVPPLDEQRAIADYLDRETAEIDAFIAEQERLIELLYERLESVHWDWAAEVRASSPNMRLKHVAAVTVGIVITPSAWYVDQGGVPALRGTNVNQGRLNLTDLVYISEEGHDTHSKSKLSPGDVVVVRTGQAGAAVVIPDALDNANAIDLLVVRPGEGLIGKFLEIVLNSPGVQRQVEEYSVGSIQSHYNVQTLKDLAVPVPELSEQRAHVESWLVQEAEMGAALDEARKAVLLANERRAALIAAAVSGGVGARHSYPS
jgi:type I restriction enzyme S subunit